MNNIPVMEPDRQYYFMDRCKERLADLMEKAGRGLTYNIQTFGCQMNAHDSEKLKGILDLIGYQETESKEADLVIFNTCTVRENANQKLYGHLGHMKSVKAKNPDMMICLCGCMMQEPHVIETLKAKYKLVDIIFGTHNIYKLAELLYQRLDTGARVIEVLDRSELTVEKLPQKRKYQFKAGVNIMYGCNNFCTYCIVPYVRGREKSRAKEDILEECRMLIDAGVKEIMLLGQNVNSYGNTNPEISTTFPELLAEVAELPGISRVRFMTSHPKDLSDELIDVIASHETVCRHIHLPVQSGSTKLLTAMNRRYTKESYLALVDRIREKLPGISLTTDIIVGFPGETEEDFLDTLDIVERVRYDQAFTFIYSKRTGTPAADYPDQISADVIKDRFDRLLTSVNRIAGEELARFEGSVRDVLVEEPNRQDASLVTGRTSENVTVHFPGSTDLIGQIVPVKLKKCKGFYFIGEQDL